MQIQLLVSSPSQPVNEISPAAPATATVKNDLLFGSKKAGEIAQPKKIEEEPVHDVAKLQKFFDENQMTLKFSRDKDTEALIVQLIDQKTGESVMQMPSEVSLKLAAEIGKMQGLFVNQKA